MGFHDHGTSWALQDLPLVLCLIKAWQHRRKWTVAMEARYKKMYTGQRNSFLFYVGHGFRISFGAGRTHHAQRNGVCVSSAREFRRGFCQWRRAYFAESVWTAQAHEQNDLLSSYPFGRCGAQIAANLTYEQRLQLLDFLVKIAQSDGNVCAAEVDALKEVAQSMQLSMQEVDSMLNLRGDSLEDAYKVLKSNLQLRMRKSVRRIVTWYWNIIQTVWLRWEKTSGKLPKKSYNASMMPRSVFSRQEEWNK